MKALAVACGLLAALMANPCGATPADVALATRGAYLARIGGCAGCHTAPNGGAPFAGGRGVPSPLGDIISSNITPDTAHGIGNYSFDDFRRAMREGTAAGGKHLYPAMPYTAYAKMEEADLRALYQYLREDVAPVASDPPPTRLPFPFNQRWLMRFWKMVFLPEGIYQPKPGHDAEWNRGAYLTQAVSHCGACHTPRGVAFEERGYDESSRHFLAGEVNDHWFGLNLTAERGAGLGRVAPETIAALLKTGQADGMAVLGSMGEEVEQSLQYMTDADVKAIAVYLKSLPAARGGSAFVPNGHDKPTLRDGDHTGDLESVGAAVYRGFCAACHQAGGEGVAGAFPRLKGNPSVLSSDPSSLIRIVVEGGRPPRTAAHPAPPAMPGFAGTLTDVQQAQVLSYVRSAWGNSAEPVTTNDVSKLRKAIKK